MKELSGKFVLRLPSDLHARLSDRAKKTGVSLNQYCVALLQNRSNEKDKGENTLSPSLRKVLDKLKTKFSKNLLGVAVFGSRATGQETEASDLDLLVVLDRNLALSRNLYRWWDEQDFEFEYAVNPHFVYAPVKARDAGGLWLEVASSGKILFDRKKALSASFQDILKAVESGMVRRYWAHGHPYWVWQNEKQIVS